MIKKFRHKSLEEFFETRCKRGIQSHHASRLGRQVRRLDEATSPIDMNIPDWGLQPLEGPLSGHFAVSVNGNWRMTFTFEGEHAILVDYQDYH
jgi:proteic killer suppression protein